MANTVQSDGILYTGRPPIVLLRCSGQYYMVNDGIEYIWEDYAEEWLKRGEASRFAARLYEDITLDWIFWGRPITP